MKKRPTPTCCKISKTSNARAPWRVFFTVEQNGKPRRTFKSFADEERARKFAEEKDIEIANYGIQEEALQAEARRALDVFRADAHMLALNGGVVPKFDEFVATALAAFRREREINDKSVTVAEGVERFLDYKITKVGVRMYRDLADRLRRFAQSFGTHKIQSISSAEIEAWLASLSSRHNPENEPEPSPLSPLSRNHYRAALVALFNFGAKKDQGWITTNPLSALGREKIGPIGMRVYSPEDAAALIQTALDQMPELVPVLALGLFAGLRVAEAYQIELSELFALATGSFDVLGKNGKKQEVPLTAPVQTWLTAQPRRKGPAWAGSPPSLSKRMLDLCKLAGVKYIPAGARSSWLYYQKVAMLDIAVVTDACVKDSEARSQKLGSIAEAKKYFSIRPAPRVA